MITILIGGILTIFFIMECGTWGLYVGIGVGILSIVLLLLPIEGYFDEQCIKEIPLIKLRRLRQYRAKHNNMSESILPPEEDIDKYYLEIRAKKATFAYDNREQYAIEGKAYEEQMVCGNIKIYEDENCKSPVLKVFKQVPSRWILTLAPFSTRTKYVFYVPCGTVDKW